jgi:hypothetical protein
MMRMTSPRRGARAASRGAALMVALALTACSQGGLTAAQRLRATTLPTPTKPGVDVHRVLDEQLTGIVDARSVTVDEDLVVDGQESESRLGWGGRGTIVDASILPITSSAPAVEVYRSPTRLLSRPTGNGVACWSEASPALDRFDRSQAPERSVLRSARAISGQGTLIKGTVSALALLRIIGTDVELRRRDLLPPAGVAVAATFGIGERGTLQVTTTWSDLVAAAGNSSRHTRQGTWTLQFRATGSDGPTPPPAGQVVSVPRTDPSYAAAVSACNARIH